MVPAGAAGHMRGDDYVIGVAFGGRHRAYPLWVIDNYHVVNDQVDGDRLLITSCERCQSGGAFVPSLPGNVGRPPLFRGVGFANATLLMKDLRTGSYWNHYEGTCLYGRSEGRILQWVPAFHTEWAMWAAAHPDTVVMTPPKDPRHPDARHGHGRDEIFARPGMEPDFVPTIAGKLDTTYPENEMVLGVWPHEQPTAFPLTEVRRERGVVLVAGPSGPVVVFAGPEDDGFAMAAYVPVGSDRDLTFSRRDGSFIDGETGSSWNIEGSCVEGELAGSRLEPVPWYYVRWHAWVYNHRDTRLFQSGVRGGAPRGGDPWVARFTPVLQWMEGAGHRVRIEGAQVSQLRPREATASLVVMVDGHRLNLHAFGSSPAAADFEAFSGAWSGLPLRSRVHATRIRRSGTLVLESDPEERFVDPLSLVPLSDEAVQWAPILEEEIDSMVGAAFPDAPAPWPGFADVLRTLRLLGYEVLETGFLPPGQLRPGCENGVAATIEGDRFLLYRFESPGAAEEYARSAPSVVTVGAFALRSTPTTMYVHQGSEILYAGDDAVRWSPLLGSERFLGAVHRAVRSGPQGSEGDAGSDE